MVYEALLRYTPFRLHIGGDGGGLYSSSTHAHRVRGLRFQSKQVKLRCTIIMIISSKAKCESKRKFRINYFNLSSVELAPCYDFCVSEEVARRRRRRRFFCWGKIWVMLYFLPLSNHKTSRLIIRLFPQKSIDLVKLQLPYPRD